MSEWKAYSSEFPASSGPLNAGIVRSAVTRRICWIGVLTFLTCIFAVTVVGCGGRVRPLFRMGSCFGSITKVNFRDPSDLGRHRTVTERNGMVGTCEGGFIDLGHVRNAVDLTRWLARGIESKIMKGKSGHSFSLTDPSRHYLEITYPDKWDELGASERETIAKDVSIQAAAHAIYMSTTWHEIITYLGWKPVGIPVFISALSPEDNYSNLLGVVIGATALRDTDNSFNQAVTLAMNKEFRALGIQPKSDVRAASKNIYGLWYVGEGYFGVKMLRRHLDIGLGDNMVEPWLIPGLCDGARPRAYRVPGLDFTGYGFSIRYSIKPTVKGKVTAILGEKVERIQPDIHLPKIMEYIRIDAATRFASYWIAE